MNLEARVASPTVPLSHGAFVLPAGGPPGTVNLRGLMVVVVVVVSCGLLLGSEQCMASRQPYLVAECMSVT